MKLVYNPYEVSSTNGASKTEGLVVMYNDDGTVVDEWHALSGGWGFGSLPHGIYELTNARQLPDEDQFKAYKHDGFPWGIDLKPQFKTHRTGLMIHPDGNLQGSLGCLCPQRQENDMTLYHTLKPLIDHGNLTTLEVL